MLKYVPAQFVEDDDTFPYDFRRSDYPPELLRSVLYSAWWTRIEGDQELALVMDYDGFVEWYNTNKSDWAREEGLLEEEQFTAEEYLPYHLGRTLTVVKEV